MERFRTNEIRWTAAAISGSLAVLAGWLVFTGISDATSGVHPAHLTLGLANLALPLGFLLLFALLAAVWTRQRDRWLSSLAASLLALVAVLLLMSAAGQAYRAAGLCPTSHCDSVPYPTLQMQCSIALMILVPNLVGIALLVLNALDGYVNAREVERSLRRQ